jgi:hypothetical protein
VEFIPDRLYLEVGFEGEALREHGLVCADHVRVFCFGFVFHFEQGIGIVIGDALSEAFSHVLVDEKGLILPYDLAEFLFHDDEACFFFVHVLSHGFHISVNAEFSFGDVVIDQSYLLPFLVPGFEEGVLFFFQQDESFIAANEYVFLLDYFGEFGQFSVGGLDLILEIAHALVDFKLPLVEAEFVDHFYL